MNQAFVERMINAACTAVGVALIFTLDPLYVSAGVFGICMSFPDCFGFFTDQPVWGVALEEEELDA